MKGRYFFIIFAIVFLSVGNFLRSNVFLSVISVCLSILAVGVYFGIRIKEMEMNYNIENKKNTKRRKELVEDEDDFMASLKT